MARDDPNSQPHTVRITLSVVVVVSYTSANCLVTGFTLAWSLMYLS